MHPCHRTGGRPKRGRGGGGGGGRKRNERPAKTAADLDAEMEVSTDRKLRLTPSNFDSGLHHRSYRCGCLTARCTRSSILPRYVCPFYTLRARVSLLCFGFVSYQYIMQSISEGPVLSDPPVNLD